MEALGEHMPAAEQHMLQWLWQGGTQWLPGLQLQEVVPGERGLVSLQKLAASHGQAPLIELPLNFTLSAQDCEADSTSFVARLPATMRDSMRQSHALLHLCFLEHYLLHGQASRFAPFLLAMPRSLGHLPLLTSLNITELLAGSYLLDDLLKHRRDLQSLYEEIAFELPDFQDKVSAADFLFTYCLVESHSHVQHEGNNTDTPRMMPLIDLVNHRSVGESLRLAPGLHGGVAVYSTRSVGAGEELFFRYSQPGEASSKFFAQFGFVDESLSVVAKLALALKPHHPNYKAKRLLFEQSLVSIKLMMERVSSEEGLVDPGSTAHDFPKFVAWQCSPGGGSSLRPHTLQQELLPFARFVVFAGSEDSLSQYCDVHLRPPLCLSVMGDAEEVEATRFLLDAVAERLSRYPSDVLMQKEPTSSGHLDAHARAEAPYIKVRQDEKRCLETLLREVAKLPMAEQALASPADQKQEESVLASPSILVVGLAVAVLILFLLFLCRVGRRRLWQRSCGHGHCE